MAGSGASNVDIKPGSYARAVQEDSAPNVKVRYNQLGRTGVNVSHLSLGGAAFGNIYGPMKEVEAIEFINKVLDHGINYIDTAPWYGQGTSEAVIGKALSGRPRPFYNIATKVGRYEKDVKHMFDFSAEKTLFSLDRSLELLGVDYVDVVHVHDPTFAPDMSVVLRETLPTLQRACIDGKLAYIGVADYDLELIKEIIEESDVEINTVLTYAKSTLLDNRVQNYMTFFKRLGLGVINAAPTAMGLLTNAGPQTWHPASEEIKARCQRAALMCKSKNIELGSLATWFSGTQHGNDTMLCGFQNMVQVLDTLRVLDQGLTRPEEEMMGFLMEQYFADSPFHWDGVEKTLYKHKLATLQ